ncbi:MAG: DnaJ domain-containing protein [Planctomycetes bacterium]|nr:DnaJ domain-containing protein [Planctomycetota bacterium]
MLEHHGFANYYEVLKIDRGACTDEIKRSFRKLVKEYHPDRNGNKPGAETKVKQVIQAYKMLSDRSRRDQYDRMLGVVKGRNGSALKKWQDTTNFQARAILMDLLEQKGRQALKNYGRLKRDVEDFSLLSCFSFKDFIDCTFLLGEECEKQRRYVEALEFYEDAYIRLEQGSRRQYLFDEIKDRIQKIYCRRLARSGGPKEAIEYYEKALELKLDKSEAAQVYKKMAESYLKLGDYYSAAAHLNLALSLKPNLRGVQRVCDKLTPHIRLNGLASQASHSEER